ncbi:FG-GAP-like repeat-containing protein [Flagellimonas sp. HMM57]|uniref:FG-GAP-like repeat-containing protein n=1 Tax=Flagellimonas sp. HMM57 TaxID=2905121 RepID=UPI001F1BC8CF|nr:FG-GAP-like repeat-containing protein [Flagellimonas sp. HMM57]UII77352.1 FG-GAP-like repeat-containing protein [Flagellimonas sp. HMM57]
MKNLTFLFCFFAIQIAIAQDTFTYKTVKASSVTESTVQLEGASEQTTNFSSKSINLSAASKGGGTVNGSTIGNLSVSPTGAVTYSVPIDVPPGINGIQPEIALAYNSQSGNGLAGWGWNVSGISVITRIPSTLFHDNQIDAVDFDSNDRFTLDGQRLILKIGTYGANGAEYQTESYSNIKITSHGTHHTSGIAGPSYFKVYYPDGSIAFYGQNTNSRGRNDYAITYWENPQGIRINYSYNTIQNSLRIYKISYGHRGTASPINEIEFVYGDRKRDEQSYINGTRFIRNTILKEINVRGQGGTAYRNYVIQHSETSLGYERVTSVQEKTGDNSDSRNAITFTYGNTPTSTSRVDRAGLTVQNIEQRNAKVIPLDMSGNGKMDFIVYPTTGTDARKKFWLFNDIQNAGGINFYNEANTGRFQEIFPVTWLNYDYKLLPNQGLAIIQNSGNTQVKFKVYSSGSAAQPIAYKYEKIWDAPTYLDYPIFQCDLSFETRIEQEYLSGDFDGDGLSDVVAISKPYSQEACTFNQSTNECNCQYNYVTPNSIKLIKLDRRLTTNFASSIGGFSGGPYKSSDQLLTFDANGDGKTDILRFQDGKVQVYSLNPSNSSLTLLWETSDSRINLDYPILPGDYNGDGKTDFIIPTADNSLDFATFLSRGNSFVKDVKLEPFQYKEMDYNGQGTLYGYNLIPVDINGDGRTDIIDYRTTTYNNSSNGTQNIRIYQNFKPSSTSSNPRFIFSGSTSKTGDLKHYPIPVFLSSDRPNNNLDFASISDNHVTSFVFNKDHREDVAMQQVTNNGVTTTIKYDQVNPYYNGGGDPYYFPSYSAGYGEVYPFINVNVAPSFKVVRELEQNGSGLTRNQKFYYKGAVSHATGLGFVGFQELKRSNWYGDGVGTLWNISKHDPMLRGAVTEQIVANSSSSNPSQYQSKVNYFYDYKLIANPGSPSAPQYMENITRSSSISGAQTDFAEQTITFLPGFHAIGANGNYHAYIFPPSEQPGDVGYAGAVDIRLKRMETDNGLTGVSTTETYSYDAYNNPLVTNTSFTGGNKATTYQYYNNASASNNTYHIGRVKTMTERITLNGNSFNTEEQYAYSNNLVTQVKKRGNGTNWLTEDFTHDVYGNVLTKTLTASGLSPRTETFEYSATYGGRFLTKSIDIEGLETTFSYTSATGNLVSTTNPYGLTTSYINDKWDRVDRMTDYLNNHTDYTYTPLVGEVKRIR